MCYVQTNVGPSFYVNYTFNLKDVFNSYTYAVRQKHIVIMLLHIVTILPFISTH